jgi:2-iminobutanoate/2-iminopropanoate deaminase
MYIPIALVLTLISLNTAAQVVKTTAVYNTDKLGFSQAVVANGLVFTSGQVAWDTQYQLPEKAAFEAQATQCFKNLDLVLQAANSSIQNSIHLRIYVTAISAANKAIVNNLLKKYFPNQYQPATTLLCVKELARKELMIEIEAISKLNPITPTP